MSVMRGPGLTYGDVRESVSRLASGELGERRGETLARCLDERVTTARWSQQDLDGRWLLHWP